MPHVLPYGFSGSKRESVKRAGPYSREREKERNFEKKCGIAGGILNKNRSFGCHLDPEGLLQSSLLPCRCHSEGPLALWICASA